MRTIAPHQINVCHVDGGKDARSGSDSRWSFTAHAAALVNDDAQADRGVFTFKRRDLLLNLVFPNLKVFPSTAPGRNGSGCR
jgi:hypothetical protein